MSREAVPTSTSWWKAKLAGKTAALVRSELANGGRPTEGARSLQQVVADEQDVLTFVGAASAGLECLSDDDLDHGAGALQGVDR